MPYSTGRYQTYAATAEGSVREMTHDTDPYKGPAEDERCSGGTPHLSPPESEEEGDSGRVSRALLEEV